MDFAFNEEQLELKRQARAWLAERYPLDRDWDGAQDDRWARARGARLARRLGREDEGGVGLGFVEEAILLEELGYALYPGPYLATVGFALAALGPEDRAAVAAGEAKWSAEVNGSTPWLGSVDKVVDMDGNAQDARGEELASVDPSRPLGRLERTNGTPLPGPRDIPRARAAMAAEARRHRAARPRARRRARVDARSSSASRSASTRRSPTSSRTRTPTSSSRARSRTGRPGASPRTTSRRRVAAAAAKAFAAEAAVAACERSIQVHGGTGFTWEHPLHRFYKRALWLEGFGSRPSELRLEVADAVLGVTVPV